MALSPAQFERSHESKDYGTGYRTVIHDIDVPGFEERGGPSGIRAKATETSTNRWSVKVVAGPHAERDETGSYYKELSSFSHEGPMGSAKTVTRRAGRTAWSQHLGTRGS